MVIATWIICAVLAADFGAAGAMKLATPYAKLRQDPRMGWAEDFSARQVRAVAAAEVLGAIGLILPWALGIARVLTPLAATGLAAVMVGALSVHARRRETEPIAMNVVLLVFAMLVAALRFIQL